MIDVEAALQKGQLKDKVFMIMQIHDELVFEVADEVLPIAQRIIKETMEGVLNAVPMKIENNIPINVSISSGKTWGEAKG